MSPGVRRLGWGVLTPTLATCLTYDPAETVIGLLMTRSRIVRKITIIFVVAHYSTSSLGQLDF